MKWKDKVINDILISIKRNEYWHCLFQNALNTHDRNIHLAVFNEPFLSLIFKKEKTIESRFSINKVIPFNRIAENDIILIKKVAGPIISMCLAKSVKYFTNLSPDKMIQVEKTYGERACWNLDPGFLKEKNKAKFLTVFQISELTKCDPIETNKRDRSAWSILKLSYKSTLFDDSFV